MSEFQVQRRFPDVSCSLKLKFHFQRLLPLETAPDLFVNRPPHPPCGRIFKARPYADETDRHLVYDICRATVFGENRVNATNHTELIGDR